MAAQQKEKETRRRSGRTGSPRERCLQRTVVFCSCSAQSCYALNEHFLAIPESTQTCTERITFSMSWRLRFLFQMINQSLFASQSWSVCSFGSGFVFYVPSAAFLIVDRSSWQLNWKGEGPRGGNWGALGLEYRAQLQVTRAHVLHVLEWSPPSWQLPSPPRSQAHVRGGGGLLILLDQ